MNKLSKFKDLSNNEVLNFRELSTVLGGGENSNSCGCYTGVCVNNRSIGESKCNTAICYSGIGVCTEQTGSSSQIVDFDRNKDLESGN